MSCSRAASPLRRRTSQARCITSCCSRWRASCRASQLAPDASDGLSSPRWVSQACIAAHLAPRAAPAACMPPRVCLITPACGPCVPPTDLPAVRDRRGDVNGCDPQLAGQLGGCLLLPAPPRTPRTVHVRPLCCHNERLRPVYVVVRARASPPTPATSSRTHALHGH